MLHVSNAIEPHLTQTFLTRQVFWMLQLILPLAALLPDFVVAYIQFNYFPRPWDRARKDPAFQTMQPFEVDPYELAVGQANDLLGERSASKQLAPPPVSVQTGHDGPSAKFLDRAAGQTPHTGDAASSQVRSGSCVLDILLFTAGYARCC
jgi:hypothetical protein